MSVLLIEINQAVTGVNGINKEQAKLYTKQYQALLAKAQIVTFS